MANRVIALTKRSPIISKLALAFFAASALVLVFGVSTASADVD